jgi:hypothetical protein
LNVEGHFLYLTGRAALEALRYDPDLISALPESIAASYCGVGNPFSLGSVRQGVHVLDIGAVGTRLLPPCWSVQMEALWGST